MAGIEEQLSDILHGMRAMADSLQIIQHNSAGIRDVRGQIQDIAQRVSVLEAGFATLAHDFKMHTAEAEPLMDAFKKHVEGE